MPSSKLATNSSRSAAAASVGDNSIPPQSSSSSTPAIKQQNSGVGTAEQDAATGSKSKSSSSLVQKDAIDLLRQLRNDLVYLDGRVNHLSQNMGSSTAATFLRDKLKEMEDEKGETEQVLSNLRGKLEEHKRLSNLKRQRLKERKEAAATPQQPPSGTATRNASLVLEGMEQVASKPGVTTGPAVIEGDGYAFDTNEKEAQELEKKIKELEQQKKEMEQTLVQLLATYEDKTFTLQQEKVQLKDDKDTTYSEMKGLLIEQHLESERLRSQVSKLEQKRSQTRRLAQHSVLALLVALGAMAWYALADDWNDRNHWCAPARPGSQITSATGPVEAPWWVTANYLKPMGFALVCGNRPRIRLELERGTLYLWDRNDPLAVTKKYGDTAYVQADTLHISDRSGGHKEIAAPWAQLESMTGSKKSGASSG